MLRVIGLLPPREIPGADRVLDGFVIQTSAGNFCRIWPAMTEDSDKDQTRVAFFMEWKDLASPEDIQEVTELTNELMNNAEPVVGIVGQETPFVAENLEWLRSGKLPKPKRPN